MVRGAPRDYAERIPTAGDVLAVIEVADSSLDYDRTTKLALYARASIAQYVIVNIRHNCIEVHEAPASNEDRYEAAIVLRAGAKLALRVSDTERLEIDVAELLP